MVFDVPTSKQAGLYWAGAVSFSLEMDRKVGKFQKFLLIFDRNNLNKISIIRIAARILSTVSLWLTLLGLIV